MTNLFPVTPVDRIIDEMYEIKEQRDAASRLKRYPFNVDSYELAGFGPKGNSLNFPTAGEFVNLGKAIEAYSAIWIAAGEKPSDLDEQMQNALHPLKERLKLLRFASWKDEPLGISIDQLFVDQTDENKPVFYIDANRLASAVTWWYIDNYRERACWIDKTQPEREESLALHVKCVQKFVTALATVPTIGEAELRQDISNLRVSYPDADHNELGLEAVLEAAFKKGLNADPAYLIKAFPQISASEVAAKPPANQA